MDTSEVRPERLEELEAAMDDLTAYVETNEPRLLAYDMYFSDAGTRMTVLHISPDPATAAKSTGGETTHGPGRGL